MKGIYRAKDVRDFLTDQLGKPLLSNEGDIKKQIEKIDSAMYIGFDLKEASKKINKQREDNIIDNQLIVVSFLN